MDTTKIAGFDEFLHQQTADEKSAQDEEEIDAHPADFFEEGFKSLDHWIGDGNGAEMKLHDRQDGDTAHEIELDYPAEASRTRGLTGLGLG